MIIQKLAVREILNNKRYWGFFILNLCIGLIGFTFIYLFRENVTATLEARAKTLLTSDIAISSRRVLLPDEDKKINDYLKPLILNETKLVEIYSMAKNIGADDVRSRLLLIKSIAGTYPLIGDIKLSNGKSIDPELISKLQDDALVIISKEVAEQFKIKIGGELKIGELTFQVSHIIEDDSTSSLRGVNLAPKVYIGQKQLDQTKLLGFGSVAFYSQYYLLKAENEIADVQKELFKLIKDQGVRVQTPEGSSEQLGRVVNYISNYLGMIGVVALLISCVGASYLFQSYLYDRLKQYGILKSIGLKKSDLILTYTLIMFIIGVLASLLTVAFSYFLLPLGIGYLSNWTNFEISLNIDMKMIATIFFIGVTINLLFGLPVLFKIFKTKTVELLSNQLISQSKKADVLSYLPAGICLWGLSVWQANSFFIGGIFFIAILIVLLFVVLVFPLLFKILSLRLSRMEMRKPISLIFGVSLRQLSRNTSSTILSILCLSIGTTILCVIGQIDTTLKKELSLDSKTERPALFLFDIQDDQIEDFKTFIKSENIELISEPNPMISARLVKKNGKAVERKTEKNFFQTDEAERSRRMTNRGVNLTFGAGINSSEKIVAGREFSSEQSEVAELSIEKRYASRLDIELGDTLTYEVLGMELQGKVVNLRTVKWTSFLPNFFIKFAPGFLEDAPKTFLGAVKRSDERSLIETQEKIVSRFSNISIINVADIITKMLTLFEAMALAVGIMSFCCLGVGLFVLYSILQSQIHKKQSVFALQKISGMSRNDIFGTFFMEYLLIVLISLFIGNIFGVGMSFLVSQLFLDGAFEINTLFLVVYNSIVLGLATLIIFYSFSSHYNKKINELLLEQ